MGTLEISVSIDDAHKIIRGLRCQVYLMEALKFAGACPPDGLDRDLTYELLERIKTKIDEYFEGQPCETKNP